MISGLADAGAERVTVSFARRMVERGHPVTLCTVSRRHDAAPAREAERAGLRRFDLAARRLADPPALARYLSLLTRERIDLVHAHGQDAWIYGALARNAMRVPLVLTRHVLQEPQGDWRERWRARAALAAARRADALVAVSDQAARALAALAGLSPRAVRVVFNGIDLATFRGADLRRRREAIRATLGFDAQDRLLLVAAAFRGGKGHEVLLEALPRVRRAVPRAVVLLAGCGARENPVRRLAAGLGDAVRFLGPRNDVPELLAACDLAVLPSRAEALPTFLIEAGAAGRASVATRVGGVPEIVEHGRTGLLVPVDDAPALASAIVELLLDPPRAEAMGAAAAEVASRRFSLDGQVDVTLRLWHEVTAGISS